jgi:hypothetical protein
MKTKSLVIYLGIALAALASAVVWGYDGLDRRRDKDGPVVSVR